MASQHLQYYYGGRPNRPNGNTDEVTASHFFRDGPSHDEKAANAECSSVDAEFDAGIQGHQPKKKRRLTLDFVKPMKTDRTSIVVHVAQEQQDREALVITTFEWLGAHFGRDSSDRGPRGWQ